MTSLRNKINLIFSVTLVLLAALFMASIKYDQTQFIEHTEASYTTCTAIILRPGK